MPGSLGELRPLVTIVSTLGLFALLVCMIPGEYSAAEYEGRELTVPEYFEGIDIQYFASIHNTTIVFGDPWPAYPDLFWEGFDLGGWNFEFEVNRKSNVDYAALIRYDIWWIFKHNTHHLKWINSKGITVGNDYGDLRFTDLDENYDENINECRFTVKDDVMQLMVYFGFNTTKYDTPTQALDQDELSVLFCVGFDQLNTAINSWNLIGMILFFQMPDVHPAINAIIAIPLWVCIAFLVYVLILKAIPFVGG